MVGAIPLDGRVVGPADPGTGCFALGAVFVVDYVLARAELRRRRAGLLLLLLFAKGQSDRRGDDGCGDCGNDDDEGSAML